MTQQQNSSFFTLGSANKPLPTLTTVQDAANTPVYEGQTQMPFQVKKKKSTLLENFSILSKLKMRAKHCSSSSHRVCSFSQSTCTNWKQECQTKRGEESLMTGNPPSVHTQPSCSNCKNNRQRLILFHQIELYQMVYQYTVDSLAFYKWTQTRSICFYLQLPNDDKTVYIST